MKTPSLFHADTIFAVPAALNPDPAKPGIPSFGFMYSIPNMIPMSPDSILQIWQSLKTFDFQATYGLDKTVIAKDGQRMPLRERVLESAKIAVKSMGFTDHAILAEQP